MGTRQSKRNCCRGPIFPAVENIICGDVLDVRARIPRECVHLVITSPPYNLHKDYEQRTD